jgi:hypothetical protein
MSGEASAPPVALLALLDVELPVPNRRERLPSDGLSHGQRRGFFPQGAHEAIQLLRRTLYLDADALGVVADQSSEPVPRARA